ncbi:helix-turn-helix domain-containing protein [Paracidovorax wautersii]|uniref:helix-turn-helix domain-containing protein n=1 Tax=Paracidovorax wautersii TaxID=1177982 RepID=UPI0031E431AD
MTAELLVPVDQIAEHLGVTHESTYRWIEHKNLTAHRVDRFWNFQVFEVDEWVRSGGANEAADTGSAAPEYCPNDQ